MAQEDADAAANPGDQGAGGGSSSAPGSQEAGADATSPATGSSGGAGASDAEGLEPLSTAQAAEGLQTPGEPKNGFDPATNFTVSTAGLQFQVPSYFKAKTSVGEDGSQYYYAETGSSVAMLMVREDYIDMPASRSDFEAAKDAYVSSMMQAADIFDEVLSSTDYELAGRAARVVTTRGAVKGVPVTAKEVFFFEEDLNTVGVLMFGQTDNAQFDYSQDFAKVVTSARAA